MGMEDRRDSAQVKVWNAWLYRVVGNGKLEGGEKMLVENLAVQQ